MNDIVGIGERGRAAVNARGVSDPVAAFVETMGLLCEADNLPRIAGRLLGLLIVEEGNFSLRELADRLQVSRASVSTNARMLSEVGIVERVAVPGDRQDYYRLARDPFQRLLTGKVRAFRHAAAVFTEAAAGFPAEKSAARLRVLELADFYRASADAVTELIERSAKQPSKPSPSGRLSA